MLNSPSEYVLQRDGTNVVTNSACAATSGTWVSPYDGATWTAASDVDIDHMVPLQNAWIVGLILFLGIYSQLTPPVRCRLVDNRQAHALCQRHHQAPALGRHRQRQPGQGQCFSRHMEASFDELLLHLRQELDPGQELLGADHHQRREDCPVRYAQLLLIGLTGWFIGTLSQSEGYHLHETADRVLTSIAEDNHNIKYSASSIMNQ